MLYQDVAELWIHLWKPTFWPDRKCIMKKELTPETLTEIIRNTVPASRIYLLSKRVAVITQESIFYSKEAYNRSTTAWFVLVLIDSSVNLDYRTLNREIEAKSSPGQVIVPLTIAWDVFDQWFNEGHPFALNVTQKATLLFAKTGLTDVVPGQLDNRLQVARKLFLEKGISEMQKQVSEKEYENAVLTGYKTLLKSNLGIEIDTSCSERLHTYCSMLMPDVPRNDIQLLALLQLLKYP